MYVIRTCPAWPAGRSAAPPACGRRGPSDLAPAPRTEPLCSHSSALQSTDAPESHRPLAQSGGVDQPLDSDDFRRRVTPRTRRRRGLRLDRSARPFADTTRTRDEAARGRGHVDHSTRVLKGLKQAVRGLIIRSTNAEPADSSARQGAREQRPWREVCARNSNEGRRPLWRSSRSPPCWSCHDLPPLGLRPV